MRPVGNELLQLYAIRKGGLALVLLASTVAPAWATWSEIGRISVHDQGERFMRDLTVKRPIEKLRLVATGGDIFCRSIQATLSDGTTQELLQGLLHDNNPLDINLRSTGRLVQILTFQCGALARGVASVHVLAN
jgi:hypothetical protein